MIAIMFWQIITFFMCMIATCGDHCKCLSGTRNSNLDGKKLNKDGYCEYNCRLEGYCGNDQTIEAYLKGIDCKSCKRGNLTSNSHKLIDFLIINFESILYFVTIELS